MYKIRKAVFPVGGIGTRFLPITKAAPKEMLPIIDRPLIQYVAEEAIAVGVEQLILVTNYTKRAIEDYFDSNYELERRLEERQKEEALQLIKNILPSYVDVVYVRQPEPLGLGDAVLRAKSVVGDEPFAVLLADDIIHGKPRSCLQQMVNAFQSLQVSVIAVERVNRNETDRYGIVEIEGTETAARIRNIVEKPQPAVAKSNLGVVGRYILTPQIFPLLAKTPRGTGGEIQLTDAIKQLLIQEDVYAYQFTGKRYDCGSKLGFIHATLAYALSREDLAEDVRALMQAMLEEPKKVSVI